jgi:hypothetical protein
MATDETTDTPILNDPPEDVGLSPDLIETFITRWAGASGTERANYQLFLTELCALLGLPQPVPLTSSPGSPASVSDAARE